MNARNRPQTQKISNIAALSMNDWCRIVAGIADGLTAAQARPVIRKSAARMAVRFGKDAAKLAAHIESLQTQEAA